ncbi:MAG: hypothetical protein ACLSTO_12990, partial [Bilophila wadsworthia]
MEYTTSKRILNNYEGKHMDMTRRELITALSGGIFAQKTGDALAVFEPAALGDGGRLQVLANGTMTPRGLSTRFSDIVNIKDFGATGDG